ncbi:MAG: hypothetical protein ACR2O0_15895, partial [Rhizobiaceae bacterium]
VIGRSRPVPGLPLISARGLNVDHNLLLEAVKAAIGELPDADRQRLGLRGLVEAVKEDYQTLLDPPFGNFCLAD